ncbi:MAG: amidophosphoribosyltransferase [Acetobacteraceae bacterium]|nr:amidophosphoribosyltransferase [Acetobacteraceae bacterium]
MRRRFWPPGGHGGALGRGAGRLREACGVFAVFGHPEAARMTYYALFALQHRGQESAGIAVSDGSRVECVKGMGLVSEVFPGPSLGGLEGSSAIGHVRYSTFGASTLANAQPLMVRFRKGTLALAHNGHLVNAAHLRQRLEEDGSIFQTGVDVEVLAHVIARLALNGLEEAVAGSLGQIRGGYALVFLTERRLMVARDPCGIRPLSMGRLGDAVVFASETCALDAVGAERVGDVAPGELVVVGESGVKRWQVCLPGREALCAFEYIYFARPDSDLRGKNVHLVRKELGRLLAREHPVEADLVIGVPDSSLSAAAGYAEAAGLPYEVGLVKNRYVGRTFIQPSPEQRALGVKIKLSALRRVIEGKRVVLVDDSIVRGTTSRHLVRLLKDAGAREVHVRIGSPPYRHPCHFGIDTSAAGQLAADSKDVSQIEDWVGASSLRYLPLEKLVEAAGAGVGAAAVRAAGCGEGAAPGAAEASGAGAPGSGSGGLCLACFNGDYPVDVSGGARSFWEQEGWL